MIARTRTAVAACLFACWASAVLAAPSAEFTRWMNLGKAHLENRSSSNAIVAFEATVKLDAQSAPAWRNLARAQMLAGQNAEALRSLEQARAAAAESVATAYLTGLAQVHQSRFEAAIPFFETAVRLDPHTATLRFQLANAYQLAGKDEQALVQYREAVRLDPLHASAQFKLATYARRSGDREEADRRQREFQRLRSVFSEDSRTPAALERCAYTQAEPASGPRAEAPAPIQVRFVDATREAFPNETSVSAVAAAVLDVDTNGLCTVFVTDANGAAALLRATSAGTFIRTSVEAGPASKGPFHQCLVGDFHNDVPKGVKYDPETHALNDVFLLGTNGCVLLKRTGPTAH